MELLLQAGIHLIKKVITFVIYGRSVQVFKACTLFYFFPAEFFFSQIFIRGEGFVPQISQIYTDILHHDFSSSDYSRNFAELWPLANGSRPIPAPVVFCHADFADDADFYSWGGFCPTDFTDIHRFFFVGIILSHRFHRYTQIFYGLSVESLCPLSGGICNDRTGRIRENP